MSNRSKTLLGLTIFFLTLVLSLWQWNVLQAHKIKTESLKTEAANLRLISEELASGYQELKSSVNASRQEENAQLELVFPTHENITTLNRLFDDFAVRNNFESNPFFVSSVTYQNVDLSEDEDYRIVPLNMTVTTSRKNLDKFIEFVTASGSLQNGVRLMSIEQINFQYPEQYGGIYSVKFEIAAYFSREI